MRGYDLIGHKKAQDPQKLAIRYQLLATLYFHRPAGVA